MNGRYREKNKERPHDSKEKDRVLLKNTAAHAGSYSSSEFAPAARVIVGHVKHGLMAISRVIFCALRYTNEASMSKKPRIHIQAAV